MLIINYQLIIAINDFFIYLIICINLFLVPSQDQALQQVILLKKELAEMRANNAMTDVNTKALTSTLQQHVNKSRGIEMSNDAVVERSAHRETLDSLETSENTVSSFYGCTEIFIILLSILYISTYHISSIR